MTPTFLIYLGNAKTMYLKADNDDCCGGGPLDLTSCTEIDIAIPNADGTFKHYLLSEGAVVITLPANLGRFSVAISADQSADFYVGELQNFNVTFTISSQKFTVTYAKALSVMQGN